MLQHFKHDSSRMWSTDGLGLVKSALSSNSRHIRQRVSPFARKGAIQPEAPGEDPET